MEIESQPSGTTSRGGERRSGDRRKNERRREDRRTPPPLWRRPAAYVAYGVAGTILVVLLLRGARSPDQGPVLATAPDPSVLANERLSTPGSMVAPSEAFSAAQLEQLVAEGEDAVGRVVRADLYCGSMIQVSVRESERPQPRLAGLVDADSRIAGAECRWGRDGRSSDFFLVIPPALAEEYARLPEVELNFVRRRHVRAHLVWLGRSEALSLRTSGVLQEIVRQ